MKLALIPARGGSKRIPHKNIKSFFGKPLIAYSIEAALESKEFDEVMVSTDDEKIKEIALKFGAKVPFLRSAKASNDFATTADVIEEVLIEYQQRGVRFDSFCCIYPTAPFLTEKKLSKAARLFTQSDSDTMISVCPFSYPVQRSLKIKNGKLEFCYPEYEKSRSQDLEKIYHDAGQFYFGKTVEFLANKKLFTSKTTPFELSELEVQDIDNLVDWDLAELKYKKLQEKKDEDTLSR